MLFEGGKMEEQKRMKAEYRSSIRSKTMIKEALLALMVEKPFDKITITDIVKKADINRGTFYAHYNNTSEVLRSISASAVDEIASVFRNRNNSDVLYNPKKYLKTISDFFLTDPQYFTRLVKTDKISEVLDDARYSAIEKIIKDLGDDCSEEVKSKIYVMLDYVIAGICTLYIDILSEKIPISLDESADYISDLLSPEREHLSVLLQHIQK